jgi:3-dehydroquinate dehydratase/shikimate dehydrogenase
MICVSICEANASHLPASMARAAEAGDVVELRLDCLPLESATLDEVERLLKTSSKPTILTFRPVEQGGAGEVGFVTRLTFWNKRGLALSASWFDLEVDLAEQLLKNDAGIAWNRVICSFHDFRNTSADFATLYQRIAATPAAVLKIAVAIDDAVDCIEIFKLIELGKSEERQIVAIGMGEAGLATRVLGPSRGAFLTYAALDETSATAPGQISAEDLQTLYRVNQLDTATDIYGVIGSPVAHSLSPHIHNAAFKSLALNAVYIPFEVQAVDSFIKRMVHPRTKEIDWNLRGLSVTAPHKSAVMDYLDWIDPAAQEIGAVNTIVMDQDKLRGYNTDWTALVAPLLAKVGSLADARVALIGAGGVARSAVYGLKQHGANITLFARDVNAASKRGESFGLPFKPLVEGSFEDFDIVINATPLGTSGKFEMESPATTAQLRGARLVYDLVYNPSETQFLRAAREAECEVLGGLPMFLAQAAEQFKLWTGREAPESAMREAAVRALEK